jgi:hypothetical protein
VRGISKRSTSVIFSSMKLSMKSSSNTPPCLRIRGPCRDFPPVHQR